MSPEDKSLEDFRRGVEAESPGGGERADAAGHRSAGRTPEHAGARVLPEMPSIRLPAEDPWAALRRFTPARIAIGRSGGSQTTRSVLDFRLSHARARDAVRAEFDAEEIGRQLEGEGIAFLRLGTRARDRREYLLRPDLGRRLDEGSAARLAEVAGERWDLVVMISDGLSALAAEAHAMAVLRPLLAALVGRGWRVGPVCVVPFARVKLQDEVATRLGAEFSLMLLGERPGLGTPDSLGAYFTRRPSLASTDADRNCVSNIRPEGLPPAVAAAKLVHLLEASRRTGLGGVALKDDFVPGIGARAGDLFGPDTDATSLR